MSTHPRTQCEALSTRLERKEMCLGRKVGLESPNDIEGAQHGDGKVDGA